MVPKPQLAVAYAEELKERGGSVETLFDPSRGSSPEHRARRIHVHYLIKSKAITLPEDCYHAAVILYHGVIKPDLVLAHYYAQRAHRLGYHPEKQMHPMHLAAAARDRFTILTSGVQLFGTQYTQDFRRGKPVGTPRKWVTDVTISDELRASFFLPPLHHRAHVRNSGR